MSNEDWSDIASPAASSTEDWSDVASPVGAEPKQKSGIARRLLGDTAISAVKGAIGLTEVPVGIADIATGGYAGKALESIGYRPKEAKGILDDWYSPEQKAANKAVQEAEGFVGTLKAAAQNPSTIANAVVESVPLLLPGAGIARGIGAATKMPAWAAGAIGEGVVGAGLAAEQLRQNSDDGLMDAQKSAAAIASGAGTALFGAAGGKLAQSAIGRKIGLSDVDTSLAMTPAQRATGQAAQGGLAKRVAAGAVSEGLLEEMPQSMWEQAAQNFGEGKDLGEGVAEAGAMGLVTGGVMGGGFNAIPGSKYIESKRAPAEDQPIAGLLPAPNGPIAPEDTGAVDAAQKNADQLYAERAAYQEELDKLYPSGLPTLTTDPAPLQQRIDEMLGIDETKLKGLRKVQYQKQFEAALKEVVGITHDENGREIPLTMGALLDSQAMAEDAAKRRVAAENAGIRAQQLADEEMPDVAAPSIPVVGPLSAAANVAVQSGASQAMAMQQAAASVSNQGQSDTQGGISRAAQTSPLAQAPAQANDAQVGAQPAAAPKAQGVALQTQAQPGTTSPIQQSPTPLSIPPEIVSRVAKRTDKELAFMGKVNRDPVIREAVAQEMAIRAADGGQSNEQQAAAGLPDATAGESRPAPAAPGRVGQSETIPAANQNPIKNEKPAALPAAAEQAGQDQEPIKNAEQQAIADPALQNRDRGRAASVNQMQSIARNPDYMRLGPSRTPDSGAPMVFAVGGDTNKIQPSSFGANDIAVMSDGQRVPFRYAVVDASSVEPSNFADGATNPAFASEAPGTIKALNNGRTAGVRAAHDGNTAANYTAEMLADRAHGVSPEAIRSTPNPMLVRVYAEQANTDDMAAKSQGQGLGMSASERAAQDAELMTSEVLDKFAPGDIASAGNRDFVRAFVGKLAKNELADMMDAAGNLSQDGRRRIEAALLTAAYGKSDLVQELFESTDTDIKAIGNALKVMSGQWAAMRNAAKDGAIDPATDMTANLIEAVNIVRRSRAEGSSIAELAGQGDLMGGNYLNELSELFLRIFYRGKNYDRARGGDKVIAALQEVVTSAMNTKADAGLFGDSFKATPKQIVESARSKIDEENKPASQSALFGANGQPPAVSQGNRSEGAQKPSEVGSRPVGTGRSEEAGKQAEPVAATEDVKEFSLGSFENWKRQGTDRGTASGWTIFFDHIDNGFKLARKTKTRNAAGGGYVGAEIVTKLFDSLESAKDFAKSKPAKSSEPVAKAAEQSPAADSKKQEEPKPAEDGKPDNKSLQDQPAAYTAEQRTRRDEYTQDLFGQDLPDTRQPGSGAGRQQPAAENRNVVPASVVPGEYATVAEPRKTGEIKSAFAQVNSAGQAAHVLAGMRKLPQEHFAVLVLDKDNKPISVLRLFSGGTSQTSAYPDVVAMAVYETPGAATIWFAHNHPSGKAEPSSADRVLTEALSKSFGAGTGIDVAGHIVIAQTRYAEMDPEGYSIGADSSIPAGARTNAIPVTERTFRKVGALGMAITSPSFARQEVARIANGKTGVVFANAQHEPTGFLPLPAERMQKLRDYEDQSGAKILFGGAAKSNASAAFIHFADDVGSGDALRATENVYRALGGSGIRVLDAFYRDAIAGNRITSMAESGMPTGSGPFYNVTAPSTISPADKAIYGMAVEGKSAGEILKFIASASRSPFNRQVAKLLLKTGIAPEITVGDGKGWKFNAGEGNKYAAGYDPKSDTVALFRPASAERNTLHELIHAASLKALSKKGLASVQMKALFNHVKKSGKLKGMYGMSDVDEFIAEAFSNPKFQALLKQVSAPKTPGNPLSSAWHWFSRIVRGILGLPMNTESALSRALDIGVEVMRDDMKLRNNDAGSDAIRYAQGDKRTKQTDTEAFRKWFGDSKVVDANGDPLVVYHGTGATDISEFKVSNGGTYGGGIYLTPEVRGANDYAIYRGAPSSTVYPVYASIKNPASGAEAAQVASWKGEENAREELIKRGYDGVVDMRNGEIVAFYPEQIKSAIGNNGDFDGSNPDIRYNVADEGWSVSEPSKMDDLIYSLQDKQIDLKRVMQSIMQTGKKVKDEINAYLQEELFHGRAAKGVKDFLDLELRPLLADMQKSGVDMGDFEEYLWNRHAEERNKQIAKINPDMPDGGSGIDTADARAYLAGLDAGRRATMERLAAKVEAMNRNSHAVLVQSGLEKQETIDAWNGAYQHYVPLQREDVDSGHMGTGKGFSVRGSSTKRAMGSGKKVVDIIANLTMQRERNIVRAEKNRVSNALLGLALENPNPDFWKVDQAPKERVVEETAIYTVLDANGKKIDEFTRMSEAERLANKTPGSTIDQTWGDRVNERITPGFKNRDNVILTRINGEDHYIILNERDERAMRLSASMKNLDMDNMGRALSIVGKATRYLASVNTQYNPVFGVINLIRDVQGALLNLQSTQIAGEQKRVAGYTVDALRGIYADIRAHRAGKVPSSNWAKLFEEFQKEGGQTGYRDQYANAEARAEAIVSELKQFNEGKPKRMARAVFGWLSDYNETMENAVRLAAYKTAKEKGLSNQQAASIAKNLTVNFNRKGQMTTQIGALYAFFNASVQGTARLAETLFEKNDGDPKKIRLSKLGKQIITGGIMLGSMQALLLAAAGFDDDEPPEFIRERNLILPIGDGKYLTLAMPLGFHVIPGIGRIATEFALSGFKDPAKRTVSMLGMFAETFNPIGSAGLSIQTLTPSVVDPFAALAENRDFTGREIYRENFNANDPSPGHARAKDVATIWSRYISEAINFITGGTEFKPGAFSPSPDAIDYLIAQAGGGVMREANKVFQTGESTITGDDLPLYKIPLVGRFIGDTEGQSGHSQKFYSAVREINMHEREVKGLREAGRADEARAYIAENPVYRMSMMANNTERQVRKLRDVRRKASEDGDADKVRAINDQITGLMTRFNERAAPLLE